MSDRYPYDSKPAQLKRWQSLVYHKHADARFLTLLLPILESLYQVLRQFLHSKTTLTHRLSDAWLANHLRKEAINLFLPMISKCCVLEMHKQRMNNRLSGETPEARFDDFIEQCKQQPIYQKFWSTYPVLAKCIETKATQYEVAMFEFFQRIDADLPTIERELLKQPLARFTTIKASGDTHRQCRRVFIVTGHSQSGSIVRFVYKPRSLSNELYFRKLCAWYNQKHTFIPLRTPALILRQDYGYAEFIPYKTCSQNSEVGRFYHALGELMALLLLVNGLDLHHENIIAHGQHPFLIDLECIMNPMFSAHQYSYPNVGQSLILPHMIDIDKKNKGVDLSALNGNNQQSWHNIPCWNKPGTDEMHLVREGMKFKVQNHVPRIHKKKSVPFTHYQAEFFSGFRSAYQTLLTHRDDLLSEQSPLFQTDPIITRCLFRNTNEYSVLLSESYHPLLLDDATHYEEHVHWLYEILPYRPYYRGIIAAEYSDIMSGDIPYFESRSNEATVYDSRQNPVPIDLIRTGEEQCRHMLKSFSKQHLATQCELIKLSFLAYTRNQKNTEEHKEKKMSTQKAQIINNQDIIEHLAKCATISENFISWPQLSLDTHQSWVCDFNSFSFYSGTMGIAFALAHWDYFQGCLKSRRLTEQVLQSIYSVLCNHPAIGFGLSGYAGLLYAAHHIHKCGYPLAGAIVQLLIKNSQSTPNYHDEDYDVMSGISHDITTLLHFLECYEIDESIIHNKMAYLKEKCPEPATFCHDENSVFIHGEPHPPILSYAHGIAGVAIAFSRYAKRFDDDFAKQWVFKTTALLDKYFDEKQGFWPDMRMAPEVTSLKELCAQPPAWCGGHVGIGLFYIECYEQWPALKTRALQQLSTCINLSQEILDHQSLLSNLCCGFYGDLDFLHILGERIPEASSNAHEATHDIITKLKRNLFACQYDSNTISLFRGIPSYLYCQLRSQYPKNMPSAIFW